MNDEAGRRARRAAEDDDSDTPTTSEGASAEPAASSRPKRFMTPDWDDWDESTSGDSPDDDQPEPVRGGRFAADPEPEPWAPQTPVAARGRFSMDEPPAPAWPARSADAALGAPAWPAPKPADQSDQTAPAGPGRARHIWTDGTEQPAAAATTDATAGAEPSAPETSPGEDAGSWHAIPVEPVAGASRAAQTPSLAEKRRREAPALPTTPPPMSPAERREALAARERVGRSVAPGSVAGDDWTDAPLPASAVPPPAVGQAPTPIAVQEGDAPVAHRAYTRPADESEDEDTLWLSRKPSSRAAEPSEPSADNRPTPLSASSSASIVSAPSTASPVAAPSAPPVPSADDAPVAARPSFFPPAVPPTDPVQAFGTGRPLAEDDPGQVEPPISLPPAAATTTETTTGTEPAAEGAATEGPGRKRRSGTPLWRRRPIQIGVAALVLAVAIVAGFLVWANRETPSAAASSQTAAALAERLVTPTDLSGVGPGQWTEQKTESTVTQDSPAPLCFVASPDLPTPTAQAQRKLSATGASLLHRITSYATAADASQVYAQRLTQLGQCSNIPVYLSNGATVSSLGDEAVGVTAVIQDPTAQYHTVILVRTGSMILTYDIAQAGAPIAYESILAVAATTVTALCSTANGGCSASPVATTGMPPNSAVPGWLTVSDLPRITTGMGRWNATSPKTTVSTAGSACENVTFSTVAGPNQRRQRTYLLTEDTKVPKDFGLDEVILDFDTADAAATFAAQLKTSITACPARTATAKLGNTGDITATGANGQAVTGFWRTVTQSTNPTTTFVFRVGVASVGTRVVYLLATPSATFDFTDADWAAITARAGQRATQGG